MVKLAVILCGGMGSRLKEYTNNLPKPMMPCSDIPFLWYVMDHLSRQNLTNFLLLTGYLSEKIKSFFGNGKKWSWNIEYSDGPVEWDTGRRLWEVKDNVPDNFLILYSDNFSLVNINNINLNDDDHSPLSLVLSKKENGNIEISDDNVIVNYDNTRSSINLNYVEIGYMLANKNIYNYFKDPDCNFSDVIKEIVERNNISAYLQNDNYYSISDRRRWLIAEKYLKPKKIILIDRDGN